MRRTINRLTACGLGAVVLIGAGCVPQDRYDQLVTANRSLEEQLVRAENERDALSRALENARGDLSSTSGNIDDLSAQNVNLQQQLNALTEDYDQLLLRVSSMEMGPLPPDMESQLTALAAKYPNILTFNADMGMLRFASDLTFDSGKDSLKPAAVETLNAVAEILRSQTAQQFEVRVIGHTDNVPIKYSKAQHPTNTHLSVHRAISVQKSLVDAGINPVRIQVAGYGEFRPLVPNRSGGTRENRRVEIFLLPMPDLTMQPQQYMAQPEETVDPPASDATNDQPLEPMK
jgi:chemotaxis protein MotB